LALAIDQISVLNAELIVRLSRRVMNGICVAGYFGKRATLPKFTLLTSGSVTSASEMIRAP
jgi:hypothetical protein